jgi:hypothetical protein
VPSASGLKQSSLAFGKSVVVSGPAFHSRMPGIEVAGTTDDGCVSYTLP